MSADESITRKLPLDKLKLEIVPEEAQVSDAENRFRSGIIEELEKLTFLNYQTHLTSLLLMKRLVFPRELKLPTPEEISKASKRAPILNKEQVVRALIVQGEIQTLRAAGCSPLDALQQLLQRARQDSVKYDENELQVLYNAINNDQSESEVEESKIMVSDRKKGKLRVNLKSRNSDSLNASGKEKMRKRRNSSPTGSILVTPELKKKRM